MPQHQSAKERLEQLRQEQEARGAQTARERLAALRALDQGVEMSPVPVGTQAQAQNQAINPFVRRYGGRNSNLTPETRAAAQAGVDIFTDAPTGGFTSGFAQNDALRADSLKKSLSEYYGQEVRVRKGPDTGELEFLNPETRRWTSVNAQQVTGRDIAAKVGPAIPATLGIAGEVFAGPLGAVAGAAGGEAIRRGIGNLAGVRDESAGDAALGSLGIGALEGGMAKGGDWIGGMFAGIRKFFKPEVMTADFAASTLARTEALQDVADHISAVTGQRLQPFTGQLTDDPLLLSEQARVRGSKTEGIGIALRQQESANETALEGYFDVITPQGGGDPSIIGGRVQAEAAQRDQPIADSIRATMARQAEELERLTAQLPRAADDASGRAIRARLEQLRAVYKANEDALWADVRLAYGYNEDTALSQVRIPVAGQLERQIRIFRAEASEALDPAITSGKRQLAGNRLLPDVDELTPEDAELLRTFGVDFEETHTIDLHQTQVLLSFLRKRERIALEGVVATDPAGSDIIRMKTALQEYRNAYLMENDPELLMKIQEAENATAFRANTFDKFLVGDILRQGQGGRYAIRDADVVARTIASRDVEAIRHLTAVMSDHPAGIATLQRTMLAYYENEVVRDGIPDATLHRAFMRRNEEVVNEMFGSQANRIKRLGEFERVVANTEQRLANFEKQIARRFSGRIQGVDPERVVEAIFNTTFSSKDARELMALAEASGFGQMYRKAVGDQMRRRFITPGNIRTDELERFVGDEREKLVSIMGPQYVQDMETLLSMARVISRSSHANVAGRTGTETVIETIARPTVARPLSAEGVGLTKLLDFRGRARERAWAAIVSDPQALHAVILRANRDSQSREAMELFGALGASAVIMQMKEQ